MGHSIQESILHFLQKDPTQEQTTSQIIQVLYKEEYLNIDNKIQDQLQDKQQKKNAKYDKAKLHRKILYHLNQLVLENKIQVVRTSSKGEKSFIPLMQQTNQHSVAPVQLRSLAREGPLIIVDPENMLTRINACLINCKRVQSMKQLARITEAIIPLINDVMTLDNIEYLINTFAIEDVINVLQKIIIKTPEQITCNLIIDIQRIQNTQNLITLTQRLQAENIIFLLRTDARIVQTNHSLHSECIRQCAENKVSWAIVNKRQHPSPLMIGKMGTYTLNRNKWEQYIRNENIPTILICSFTTMVLDLEHARTMNYTQLKAKIVEAVKGLLRVNYAQYLVEENNYAAILRYNMPHIIETNLLSTNYIRFKNISEDSLVMGFLASVQEEIDTLLRAERIIYKSCGIPLTFNVNLAEQGIPRIILKNHSIDDEEKMKLSHQEKITSIFKANHAILLEHKSRLPAQDILRSVNHLLEYYRVPCILYKHDMKTTRRLTDFL